MYVSLLLSLDVIDLDEWFTMREKVSVVVKIAEPIKYIDVTVVLDDV